MARPLAVLTVHGMGTHLPLTGIQDMVKVLERDATNPDSEVAVSSEVVTIGGSPAVMSSAVVELMMPSGPTNVTVFEANYSAIPKGSAGLMDVIKFLFFAGWNGLGADNWNRWLFGKIEPCRPKNFTHFALLTVIAALLSLIGLNALVTAEVFSQDTAAHAAFNIKCPPFQTVLCLAMVVILTFGGAFGVFTLWSRALTAKAAKKGSTNLLHRAVSAIGYGLFLLLPVVVVVMTGYVGLRKVWPELPIDAILNELKPAFIGVRLMGAEVAMLVLAKLLSNRPVMKKVWNVVLTLALVTVVALSPSVRLVVFDKEVTSVDFWILGAGFMLASAVFKGFLVDYAGDVAAYIGGSQASKFADVRDRVQARVRDVLKHILESYDVVVVAHSLGSVVAYDVVNRVLLENPKAPIKALVTYGCPLDKIAYLFRTEAHHGDEIRDELVGTRQPFVSEELRKSIPWWNVQARYDIVGSRLAYYNNDTSGKKQDSTDVRQVNDQTNLTPLASHSAYSDHDALTRTCFEALQS